MEVFIPDISTLLERDPCMRQHEQEVRKRYGDYQECLQKMREEGGLERFAMGYKMFGPQVIPTAQFLVTWLL